MKITTNTKNIDEGDIFFCFKTAEKYLSVNDIKKSGKIFAEIGFFDRNTNIFFDNYELKNKVIECKNLQEKLVEQLKNTYKIPEKFIAITGTKGKTSSCWFIFQMLSKFNIKVGYIGTLGVYYNISDDKIGDNICKINKEDTMTTPSIDDMYYYMDIMYNSGVKCVVFEASSHSLLQGRLDGLKVDVGVFTNLSQDHLDYHKNIDDYFEAKTMLFSKYIKVGGNAILNIDNVSTLKLWRLEEICSDNKIKPHVCGDRQEAECKILSIKQSGSEQIVEFSYSGKTYIFATNIIGKFQIYNLIDAILCCHFCFDIDIRDILTIIGDIKAPLGRMQKVDNYDIFVDYSHTPKSLEEALIMLKNIYDKVIVVFGCGGNRDKQKRPIMFEIAKKISKICIITEDNSRNENIDNIVEDILCFEKQDKNNDLVKDEFVINQIDTIDKKYGNDNNCDVKIIKNREEAIEEAIKLYVGDIKNNIKISVLVAGKGHENYKIIGDKKIITDCDYDICLKKINDII